MSPCRGHVHFRPETGRRVAWLSVGHACMPVGPTIKEHAMSAAAEPPSRSVRSILSRSLDQGPSRPLACSSRVGHKWRLSRLPKAKILLEITYRSSPPATAEPSSASAASKGSRCKPVTHRNTMRNRHLYEIACRPPRGPAMAAASGSDVALPGPGLAAIPPLKRITFADNWFCGDKFPIELHTGEMIAR